MSSPTPPTVVVTGASSGIGLACAAGFARQGYTVWALARRPVPVPAGLEDRIRCRRVDVTDEAAVQAVFAEVASAGPLGIVLHCAGMGIAGAAEDTLEDAVRAQFEVNYFGVLRVNRCALPLLRAQGNGLVIVMGSVAGRVAIPFQSHYSSTKHALDAYVEALRLELRPFGVQAVIVEPGDIRTGFTAARQMALPEGSPYEASCRSAVDRMARDEENGGTPESIARAVLRLAGRRRLPVRMTVGLPYQGVIFLRRVMPEKFFAYVLGKLYS
ncbi:MAG: SDR family oxidoreductase [Oscillospiraceae bacterium]|jgi:NAD(P)-dependent dehydrogenase (short-subunit alcohol dehydrogenase family)|nr:SDR family oxidoreductase [Oscillospiraceae bacterium]